MKKHNKKLKNEPMTLNEFKAWLGGLEEALGEEWVPNKDQWCRIKGKLETLIETPIIQYSNNAVQSPPVRQPITGYGSPIPAQIPMVATQATVNSAPLPTSNLGKPPKTTTGKKPPMLKKDGETIQTGDIDTSNGSYESAFV